MSYRKLALGCDVQEPAIAHSSLIIPLVRLGEHHRSVTPAGRAGTERPPQSREEKPFFTGLVVTIASVFVITATVLAAT